MESASNNMHHAIDEGHKRIDKILLIKQDQVSAMGKRLNDIVNTCLEIDIRGDTQALKRQKAEEEQQLQR